MWLLISLVLSLLAQWSRPVAINTWYLNSTVNSNGYGVLSKTTPSPATNTGFRVYEESTGTGYSSQGLINPGTNHISASGNSWNALSPGFLSRPIVNQIVQLPSGKGPVASYITERLFGIMDKGTWHLLVQLHGDDHGWDSSSWGGFLDARVWRANNALGTDAVEIASGIVESPSFNTIVNNSTQQIDVYFDMPNLSFAGDYLFFQFALKTETWSLDCSGTCSLLDFDLLVDFGANSRITTPRFSQRSVDEATCKPFNTKELYIYIAPDGTEYPLDIDNQRVVLSDQGTGTPKIEYVTTRGPFQHGESLRNFFLQPRVVQLMVQQRYNNRDAYWYGRQNLLGQISPRRQTFTTDMNTGVLRRILSTGDKRDLNCLIQEGPNFEPRKLEFWDELSFTEALRFIAFDPVYFDPTPQEYVFAHQGSTLVFGTVFPFTFSTLEETTSIENIGTWLCYPTFTVVGPLNLLLIQNQTTDESIEIQYDLLVGRTITITLDYANKAVVLDDGTNLMPYVKHDSQLGTFHLTETNEGVNTIYVLATGVNANSEISMSWNPRFVGI